MKESCLSSELEYDDCGVMNDYAVQRQQQQIQCIILQAGYRKGGLYADLAVERAMQRV
ncbi:hypothetical protein P3S67_029951 [Capsicum chacoense]